MTEGLRPPESSPPAPGRISALRSHWPIVALLALGIIVGLLFVQDYGMSTDEYGNARVGEAALRAYTGSSDYFRLGSLVDHGPVYFMIFSASSEALVRVFPHWLLPDGRHFTNYLTFLAGVLFFYMICLQVIRRSEAVVATVLFATQPILFGSAFINQKDIPFMSFFLGVIALGLLVGGERRSSQDVRPPPSAGGFATVTREFVRRLRAEWRSLEGRKRKALLAASLVGLLLLVDLLIAGSLHRLGESMVVAAFNGRAPWPIQSLYTRIATDAYKTSLELYLARYESLFAITRLGVAATLAAAGLMSFGLALPSVGTILRGDWSKERYPALIAGGVLLGCTISVRQIGVFAGGLASLYLLYRGRARAVLPLCLYWVLAALVTYATWPYLWADPIQNALYSFLVVPQFGAHNVLFRGMLYPSGNLPWSYFPTLVSLDLTEPALILVCLGLGVVLWRFLRGETNRFVVGILVLWFGVPVYWLIAQRVPIYNNIRHFLFVFPPLLVFAGVGFEALLQRARSMQVRALLSVLAIAPGVWGIIWLHPYEYSYFNSLAGGVSGAFGEYDLDYWCTSLKEATEIVDQVAEHGDTFQVMGPLQSAAPYARGDLMLFNRRLQTVDADHVAVCTHRFGREWDSSGYRLVGQVRRGAAVFAEVWVRQGDLE